MTYFDDKAYTINDLIAAVIAIETELGVLPAGDYASVRTRLDVIETRVANNGTQNIQQRTVSSPTYTVDSITPDFTIFTDSTSNSIVITLPVPTAGRNLIIKDKTGQAAIHSVTISHHASETIDGANTYVLDLRFSAVQLISDGTNWSVCGSYNGTVI